MALSTWMFQCRASQVLQFPMPSYTEITAALQTVRPHGGAWVGPSPRVVRTAPVGSFITSVAQPFTVDDDGQGDVTANQWATLFGTDCLIALSHVSSSFGAPAVARFNPAANGAIADWQNGTLAATMTRDDWPTLGGRLAVNENEVGPNTPANTLPTVGTGITQQVAAASPGLGKLGTVLWIAGGVAAGAFALWVGWPWIEGARSAARPRKAA